MTSTYNRTNPFLAKIKVRDPLCKKESPKQIFHVVVDLADSGLEYSVGDSLGVLPTNDSSVIEQIFNHLEAAKKDLYFDSRTNSSIILEDFLLKRMNLNDCTKNLLELISKKQPVLSKKLGLESVISSDETFKAYQKSHDVLACLEDNDEVKLNASELCSSLKPMLPRFYSIASSQKAVSNEAHLTVALQKWQINGRDCFGVCTHFLCELAPVDQSVLPIYLQPSHGFTLPKDSNTPIIMIGPGTGIAPFRGFMQEREVTGAKGKNWLFFGEWHKSHHFFYEPYWNYLKEQGKIAIDLAFSRDHEEKIYVQHRLLEKGKDVFRWLQEGAHFYVCGDASRMAKDVDEALHQIIQAHGGYSSDRTKEFVKQLKTEKRYLRDVY